MRLKYLLKFANTYDSTWDNVDVIKWSLIEILSACICGNLLPLRPLVDKIIPPVRSLFSWYTRSFSRRSSDKHSGTFSKFSWLDRFGKSNKKPQLISTLDFTKVDLKSGWDWKDSDASELISPTTPCPAHVGEKSKGVEVHEHDVEAQVPRGMIRKTSTTVLNSTRTMSDSEGRASRNDSERGLMPPKRETEKRHSGPWSYALDIFNRDRK